MFCNGIVMSCDPSLVFCVIIAAPAPSSLGTVATLIQGQVDSAVANTGRRAGSGGEGSTGIAIRPPITVAHQIMSDIIKMITIFQKQSEKFSLGDKEDTFPL